VPQLVAEKYLGGDFLGPDVDTLVLGCTHYPLLSEIIRQVVGPKVTLIDSAKATAERVALVLRERELTRMERGTVERHYLVTDTPARFLEVGARFLGRPLSGARQIDLHVK